MRLERRGRARPLARLLVVLAIAGAGGCASHGREVFVREGCANCHRHREVGGGSAPDLSQVGSRRDAGWIGVQINNPAAHNPATRMPSYPHIKGHDLKSLVTFLRS